MNYDELQCQRCCGVVKDVQPSKFDKTGVKASQQSPLPENSLATPTNVNFDYNSTPPPLGVIF